MNIIMAIVAALPAIALVVTVGVLTKPRSLPRPQTPDAAVNAAHQGEASVGQLGRDTPQGIGAGRPDANTAAAASGSLCRHERTHMQGWTQVCDDCGQGRVIG